MIYITKDLKHLIVSRCEYLYRNNGRRDNKAMKEIGDGDICIPLPEYMQDKTFGARSDRGSLGIIIKDIRKRLKKTGVPMDE